MLNIDNQIMSSKKILFMNTQIRWAELIILIKVFAGFQADDEVHFFQEILHWTAKIIALHAPVDSFLHKTRLGFTAAYIL